VRPSPKSSKYKRLAWSGQQAGRSKTKTIANGWLGFRPDAVLL
jgi:hypothetical protein